MADRHARPTRRSRRASHPTPRPPDSAANPLARCPSRGYDRIFEPLDFMARLAALVPKPRVNLTRYHGVFAPNSAYRAAITPSQRGKGGVKDTGTATTTELLDDKSHIEKRAAMTWAQRLKRVFNIEIEICRHCQGPVKIIACIEDSAVIEKILSHLNSKANADAANQTQLTVLPMARAPPEFGAGLWPEGDDQVQH